MKTIFILALVCVATTCFSINASQSEGSDKKNKDPFGWNNIATSAKPSCFWWWMGSCVNEVEIERQLIMLKKAGFGGVMVCPLYEYKNPTIPPIKYLSDRWTEVFKFTLSKGKQLGLLVDVTTGPGWPMGGPWVTEENSERDWHLEVLPLNPTLDNPISLFDEKGNAPIKCITILKNSTGEANYGAIDNETPAKVIEPRIENGKPVWNLPPVGKCNVLVARMGYTRFDVYVASKGDQGPVFDYYSPAAFKNFIEPIEEMFHKMGNLRPRAVFCDSYEGRIGTTPDFFKTFEKINNYDLRPYMHQFLKETGTPENIRLWHDYRETIAFLHVEFVKRWTKWANQNGIQTRYQYTGDPANPINTCSAADIPEDSPPFNTSAAHIFGKKLIAAEEFTWGAGYNFIDYLDYYRKRGDGDLMQGLNHKVYHGVPFTPQSEPWPGPMYYAGGNFSETQPFFMHIRYLNDYFARLQQTLQESKPNTDVLMLWSIHDYWNMPNAGGVKYNQPFVWRNSNSAIYRGGLGFSTCAELIAKGIQTDLCSDEIIADTTCVVNGQIRAGKANFKVLVVPETKMVGAATLIKLEQLVREGATIIFMKYIPLPASKGLPLIQDLSHSTGTLEKMAKASKTGKGRVYIVSDMKELLALLNEIGISEEGINGQLSTFRVSNGGRITYLIRNNTSELLDLWVPLSKFGTSCTQAIVGNPRTGDIVLAEYRQNTNGGILVHLVFEPTELLTVREAFAGEKYQNAKSIDYRKKNHVKSIGKEWEISWSDYQSGQHQFTTDTLKSWLDYPELGLFSGIVSYKTTFNLENQELKNHWILDAGKVCESAEVIINGKKAGCVWTTPFKLDISRYLKTGENTLILEVANKAQNRIVDMYKKGTLNIKCPLEINYENESGELHPERLKPLISGLFGPVQLRCAE